VPPAKCDPIQDQLEDLHAQFRLGRRLGKAKAPVLEALVAQSRVQVFQLQ